MSEHICDEDCQPDESRTEPLELHDFIGIALGGVGAVFGNVAAFFNLCANEFYASGRYRRQRNDDARARAEAGFELERLYRGES